MFGTKALIAQYEARIADLKAEIGALRTLVLPSSRPYHIPVGQLEADAVLSGTQDILQLTPEQSQEQDEILAERDRILSGQY